MRDCKINMLESGGERERERKRERESERDRERKRGEDIVFER